MKQTFDLVSHFFALLPTAVLISTIYETKKEIERTSEESERILKEREKNLCSVILVALIFAVIFSLFYHSVDNTSDWYDVLHAIDRFTSSTIILLTFWLYIDRFENWITLSVLAIVLIFVLLEALVDFPALAVEGIVFGFVLIAIVIFWLKWNNCGQNYGGKFKYFIRGENRKRIFNLWDPFFLSFFLTQILAIVFFAVDTEPYFHSLWHLFAFISLGSVLIHSLPEDETNKYGGCTNEYFVALTYWFGSLPSRLFISWIFIHMGEGEGWPLGIVFLLLWLPMLYGLRKLWDNEMTERRKSTIKKAAVTYLIIAIFLFAQMIGVAGWILFGDTIASALLWVYYRYKEKKSQIKYRPVDISNKKKPTLNLNNMVF